MSEEQDEHDQQRRRDQHRLNTQQLGRAENTRGGDASAKKFYNTYRALCGRATTFDEMLETEIEADNLEMEIVELMMFISNTPIPQKYGALFKPPPGKGGEEDNDNDNNNNFTKCCIPWRSTSSVGIIPAVERVPRIPCARYNTLLL